MKLLLALDGSDSAAVAVDYLLTFPFPADAELVLLSVVDDSLFREAKKGHLSGQEQEVIEDTRQAVRGEGEAMLQREAERFRSAGWRCSIDVRSGYPVDEIVAVAEGLDADLIILGSHGLSGVKRFLLGSVSTQVLEYAHCSVLIVKQAQGRPDVSDGLQVLLAYDGSKAAQEAADFCRVLPLPEGSDVNLLTVMPLVTAYRQDIRQRLNTIWQNKKAAAHEALDRVAASMGCPGVELAVHLREGPSVSKEILDAADEVGCELLVLGNKGRGRMERLLLGSATTRVAQHAKCAVLVVRAG